MADYVCVCVCVCVCVQRRGELSEHMGLGTQPTAHSPSAQVQHAGQDDSVSKTTNIWDRRRQLEGPRISAAVSLLAGSLLACVWACLTQISSGCLGGVRSANFAYELRHGMLYAFALAGLGSV